jgi:hypothetical protein
LQQRKNNLFLATGTTEKKMEQEKKYDREIREDLTRALRLVEGWSHDDSQNSFVFENILQAHYSLKTALESISYTQKEVDDMREEEGKRQAEKKEKEYERKIYELRSNVERMIERLTQNKIKKLGYGDLKKIADAIEISLRNKNISEEIMKSILSLLKFCRESM